MQGLFGQTVDAPPKAEHVKRMNVLKDAKPSICRGVDCGAEIYWLETKRGGYMPVNPDGTTHWDTCKNRDQF